MIITITIAENKYDNNDTNKAIGVCSVNCNIFKCYVCQKLNE